MTNKEQAAKEVVSSMLLARPQGSFPLRLANGILDSFSACLTLSVS